MKTTLDNMQYEYDMTAPCEKECSACNSYPCTCESECDYDPRDEYNNEEE